MMVGPNMAMLPLLIIILLFIGFILLMIKKPKVMLVVLGLVVVLGLLAVIRIPVVHKVTHVSSPSEVARPALVAPVDIITADVKRSAIPDIWKPGVETQFEVSEFSSVNSGAVAMAGWVIEYLDDTMADGSLPEVIQVCGNTLEPDRGLTVGVLETFGEELENYYQQQGKECQVIIEASYPDSPLSNINDKAVMVVFSLTQSGASKKELGYSAYDGMLVMDIWSGPKDSKRFELSHSVSFNEVTWLSQTASFIANTNPGDTVVIGYSSSATADVTEAMDQAYDDASRKLAQYFNSPIILGKADLSRLGLIDDKYSQKLNGSQGDIYRAAVLVGGSTGQIGNEFAVMQQNHQLQAAKEQVRVRSDSLNSWANLATSVGILLGAILLSYFLLDYISKGYYKGRLVMVLVIIAVVGLLLISMIA